MTDEQIVALFLARNEDAVAQTEKKYGKYLFTIARNILGSVPDAEECVNDAYLTAWNSVPDVRPESLSAYLGRITRNAAINRYKSGRTKGRGGGQIPAALCEISDLASDDSLPDAVADKLVFSKAINGFLSSLPPRKRGIFVARYWYFYPISEISRMYGISENRAAVTLFRLREKLREVLEKEGIIR